ncbi:hypothetical protein [Kitasatospora purpeofusca]|uniref:hypothetical protein n=1 Tax=Kitasatospora purpeofusca TaxID=67352 RepID=UPI0037F68661
MVFAVLPIVAGFFIDATRQTHRTLFDLIGHGELLIVSAGLAAAAAGQAYLKRSSGNRFLSSLLMFTNLSIMGLTSIWFADVSAAIQDGKQYDQAFVGQYSIVFFVATLITAGAGTFLSELEP